MQGWAARMAVRAAPQSGAVRNREASNPVASPKSKSATNNPSSPYGWWHNTVPSGRAIAEVVPEPALAQFADANQQVFSAARHRIAFS